MNRPRIGHPMCKGAGREQSAIDAVELLYLRNHLVGASERAGGMFRPSALAVLACSARQIVRAAARSTGVEGCFGSAAVIRTQLLQSQVAVAVPCFRPCGGG